MAQVSVTLAMAHEGGVFSVGLAETDGEGMLVFSRSDLTDEQDALTGMDAYSISDQSGATLYGGVESAKLDGTRLDLHLTEEAAAVLGLSADLALRFSDQAEADAARLSLRRIGVAVTVR